MPPCTVAVGANSFTRFGKTPTDRGLSGALRRDGMNRPEVEGGSQPINYRMGCVRHVGGPADDGQHSLVPHTNVNVSDPFEALGGPQLAPKCPGRHSIRPGGHLITICKAGPERAAILVQIRPSIAFLFGPALLLGQPLLLGRARWFRGSTLLGDRQRVLEQSDEPLVRRAPVLRLTSAIACDDAHHPRRVQASRQLRV